MKAPLSSYSHKIPKGPLEALGFFYFVLTFGHNYLRHFGLWSFKICTALHFYFPLFDIFIYLFIKLLSSKLTGIAKIVLKRTEFLYLCAILCQKLNNVICKWISIDWLLFSLQVKESNSALMAPGLLTGKIKASDLNGYDHNKNVR